MKILDKIALILFSSIMLIISVIVCLLVFGWVDLSSINTFMKYLLNDSLSSNITLGVSIILILLSIKCIFFDASSKQDTVEKGVLLENENGKLLISKETIQNLVNGVIKKCKSVEEVSTRVILSKENKVNVEITLFVLQDAIIKDLSKNLQIQIKETIKKSLDLEVKEVNIKIKNVAKVEETAQNN